MATAAKKRIGRPMKEPAEGERISLGLKVTAEMKAKIDAVAKESGRTQSQEVERLIERALHYDMMLAAMNTTVEEIVNGNVKAAMHKVGYVEERGRRDGRKAFVERGPAERSGFLSKGPKQ
jgi:hypothetical protein